MRRLTNNYKKKITFENLLSTLVWEGACTEEVINLSIYFGLYFCLTFKSNLSTSRG